MIDFEFFDRRPIIVAIAGPNGAGKSTFFHAHLANCGLRFLNADVLSEQLAIDPYQAATCLAALREALLDRQESFVFETVFSDPAQDKIAFLERAEVAGYTVVLCYIGLADAAQSEARVAMRVSQGGHDVPTEKLIARFPRTIANLHTACARLPHVLVYDNSDIAKPFRLVAMCERGKMLFRGDAPFPIPDR